MESFKHLTDQIQINLTSNLHVRAKYLYSLYRSVFQKMPKQGDYLDIGCGFGVNSEVFGDKFNNIYFSDFNKANLVKCKEYTNRNESVFYIAADAQSLPFKDRHFDLVTAFSLVEHVPDQEQMIHEAFRILRKDGQLVMQFPNKYFFMELHTGIPFYFLIPGIAKSWISKRPAYSGLSEVNIPTPERIKKIISKIDASINIRVIKVVYPDELIPIRFRKVYLILKKIGVFKFIPFGWMMVIEK